MLMRESLIFFGILYSKYISFNYVIDLLCALICLSTFKKPISNSRVNQSSLEIIGVETSFITKWSANSAANNLVPDRLFKIDGRCKSEYVKDVYTR